MVILNDEFIDKHQKHNKFKNDKFALTHLHMNNKKIEEIGNISKYSKISVAYLHNNRIKNIEKLSNVKNLTHLYLQWNHLSSTENLSDLPRLTNLYLGYNCIPHISNLQRMPNLKMLHVQKQCFKNGSVSLTFDQETILALSKSLTELNVSDNGLTTLKVLQPLAKLVSLDASNNLLSDLEDVCDSVKKWKYMKNLQVHGNFIAKRRKYEYGIIASSSYLETLDNKTVNNATRIFLQALQRIKNKRRKREDYRRTAFSSETQSFVHQLPLEFRELVTRSIIHNRQHDGSM